MAAIDYISLRRLAQFLAKLKQYISNAISNAIQPTSDKEVVSVLTYGSAAPAEAEEEDLYINSSDNKLYVYTDDEWVEDESSTDVIYVTLDTSHMYLWNGTQFNDVTGQQVDNTIYITSLYQLDDVEEVGAYMVVYYHDRKKEVYTLYVTSRMTSSKGGVTVVEQLLNNSSRTGKRSHLYNSDWPVWEWSMNVHCEEAVVNEIPIFVSSYNGDITPSGKKISDFATISDLNAKANLSDLSAKADKPILTSPVVSGNNITLSIGKIYDLTSLGSLTNSNVIYLSDLGVITGECPTWHFFFTCGASMPGFGNDIDPIWGEDPDWSDDDLIEVDVVRVGNVYHGLWSKKDLSE